MTELPKVVYSYDDEYEEARFERNDQRLAVTEWFVAGVALGFLFGVLLAVILL